MAKTALVTGASGEIGTAICKLLGENGYNIAIAYNKNEKSAKELEISLISSGVNAKIFCAEIADYEKAKQLVDETVNFFGSLDLLVNNAGVSQIGLFTDMTLAQWQEISGINLNAAVFCSQQAVKYMVKNKSGAIVNISSIWGQTGASCEVAYSVTKAGLIGLTKALAKEVAPSGIRVNCVSPGMIETKMNSELTKEDVQAIVEETPLGRIGTVQDVAQAVLFLAGEKASFITGEVLSCNGGILI